MNVPDAKIVSFNYIYNKVRNPQCILSMSIDRQELYGNHIDIEAVRTYLLNKAMDKNKLKEGDKLYVCKMDYTGFSNSEIYKLYRAN